MKENRFRPNADYWNQKLANYLHDPPDKALHIPGHEERSRLLADALSGIPTPDKTFYQRADQIASGMDRTPLPGFSPDKSKNGAINFLESPMLTHPTGDEETLALDLSSHTFNTQLTSGIVEIIHRDLDGRLGEKGLSDKFKGDPVGFSSARFHYIHHVLRERLAQEDIGGLGGAWYRIPADTRIPDHSIWQHCALVSALSSCFELSRENRASLFVFNTTPVQDFIGRARKLRDFWTGSLILSWLAFEGIRQVIYSFGSDHLLYPSVIGQPMVNELLSKECGLNWLASQTDSSTFRGVASFPNKFVCLVPMGNEQQVAEDVQRAITNAWSDFGTTTLELIENVIKKSDPVLKEQFQRQMYGFWEFHWSACPLLDETSRDLVQLLLHKEVWKNPFEFVDASKGISFESKGEGAFYGVTHALAQSFLAAGKTHRSDYRHRQGEPGIKCSLHGDFEALRFSWEERADQNPRPAKDPFWSRFKSAWETKSDFKPSERLSALAMIKRLAPYVCKKISDHPLQPFFKEADSFPSTTEMALSDWLDRVEKNALHGSQQNWRQKLAQYIHERETESKEKEEGHEVTELTPEVRAYCQKVKKKMEEANDPVTDEDKYYAILFMDGDHMGRLVNGETLSSRWETTIHPDLVDRFRDRSFDKSYRDFWLTNLKHTRILAPAVHAAISESLGDFSLYTVPAIVERHRGRLIYAGGDDVCAIFPVSTVVQAAREIAEKYSVGFLFFSSEKKKQIVQVKKAWNPLRGRLALHLGKGRDISISAGILIAHHKKPLSLAMRRAHELLDLAKKKGGRNGFAIELEKRSGGGRIFMARWAEKPFDELQLKIGEDSGTSYQIIDLFLEAGRALGSPGKRSMSASLAYRLEQFRTGLESIIREAPDQLARFLEKQMERSDKKKDDQKTSLLANQIASLIARRTTGDNIPRLNTDSLIIAKFVGSRIARANFDEGD